ncbi:hypothetical protein ZEAMMB73_Zm00001d003289 [Zea mays]|uniref:Uncharacterized protein n=1 Tax=Zea mays TaxID=4577 RepID=A0A1D6E8E5_MAIZE|nr:hypothetical protein ZEAMMB73_Zm00001d003289 [Zea mays]ONM16688.1 hypothetical protein ZEAMMB73_Zm00001d003289 [Zea mays]ONM16690.1 hypothetical protein ZEAMMB73_Zm00001d003289 [Zea mays]ONM16691.1 hypothetical protein ZEAMMB73_Zm00001d003289 [Zea mays]
MDLPRNQTLLNRSHHQRTTICVMLRCSSTTEARSEPHRLAHTERTTREKLMGRNKKVKKRQFLQLQNQVRLPRRARMTMILMRTRLMILTRTRQTILMRVRVCLLKKAMMMIQVMKMIPVTMRRKTLQLLRSMRQARRELLKVPC